MNFYKLYNTFIENSSRLGTANFQDLLTERRMSKQFQVDLDISFDEDKRGIIEDRFARIRSVVGVTIVSTPKDSEAVSGPRRSRVRVKFIPQLSMRPVTYVRTVLLPAINSSKIVPGVHVRSVVPRSTKEV